MVKCLPLETPCTNFFLVLKKAQSVVCGGEDGEEVGGGGGDGEVDGIPVSEGLGTGELGKISRIFQLEEKCLTKLGSL